MITFTKRETIIYSRELSRSEAESIVRDHHADPESVAPLAGLTDGQLSEVLTQVPNIRHDIHEWLEGHGDCADRVLNVRNWYEPTKRSFLRGFKA